MPLVFADYEGQNDSVFVNIKGFPLLQCPKCHAYDLTPHGRAFLEWVVKKAKTQDADTVNVSRRPQAKRFTSFCKRVEFLYDSVDYEYIPGLWRPHEAGFLTPVFFRPEVLLKYGLDDSYSVILASDTYGSIYRKGSGADFEQSVSFGINQNGKVLMWLGDVDNLLVEEQHYLRAFNVPSDHDMGSEFFQGQIEAIFTEPSAETALLASRKSFLETVLISRGMKLSRLDKESFDETRRIMRPVAWRKNLLEPVIQGLYKICIENLDAPVLRGELQRNGTQNHTDNLGSLKLLQMWLKDIEGIDDAGKMMTPFFVLNDLRTLSAHLLPDTKGRHLDAYCRERLGVNGNSLKELYFNLLEKLANSYHELQSNIRKPRQG